MRDPPALQLWTCMYNSTDGGGVSRYVDGLRVAERLREANPAAYEFFRRTPLTYHCQDEGASLVASGVVFEHGPDGRQMDRFRYNDYDRLTMAHLSPEEVSSRAPVRYSEMKTRIQYWDWPNLSCIYGRWPNSMNTVGCWHPSLMTLGWSFTTHCSRVRWP